MKRVTGGSATPRAPCARGGPHVSRAGAARPSLVPERGPSHHQVLGVRGNSAKFSLFPRGVSALLPNNGIWDVQDLAAFGVRKPNSAFETGARRSSVPFFVPLLLGFG